MKKNTRRRVGDVEGAPESGAPYRNHIIRKSPTFLCHFQGAFLDRGYPGLKPGLRKAHAAAGYLD
jgi:hypothetical protein